MACCVQQAGSATRAAPGRVEAPSDLHSRRRLVRRHALHILNVALATSRPQLVTSLSPQLAPVAHSKQHALAASRCGTSIIANRVQDSNALRRSSQVVLRAAPLRAAPSPSRRRAHSAGWCEVNAERVVHAGHGYMQLHACADHAILSYLSQGVTPHLKLFCNGSANLLLTCIRMMGVPATRLLLLQLLLPSP